MDIDDADGIYRVWNWDTIFRFPAIDGFGGPASMISKFIN